MVVGQPAHSIRVPSQSRGPVDYRGGREPDAAAGLRRRLRPDRREPDGDSAAVYVVIRDWDGMGLLAKRIEHVARSAPSSVVLKSLNREYDSHECSAEATCVVGQAVWVSRRPQACGDGRPPCPQLVEPLGRGGTVLAWLP